MILRRESVQAMNGYTSDAWDILAESPADLADATWAGIGSLAYCMSEEPGARVYVKASDGWKPVNGEEAAG